MRKKEGEGVIAGVLSKWVHRLVRAVVISVEVTVGWDCARQSIVEEVTDPIGSDDAQSTRC